jgi:hypothetical protein
MTATALRGLMVKTQGLPSHFFTDCYSRKERRVRFSSLQSFFPALVLCTSTTIALHGCCHEESLIDILEVNGARVYHLID